VFFPKTGSSLLFDLGELRNLATKELLRVDTALVSHCHIDHFIGFDEWLRAHVPHSPRLRVVGPEGIAQNVFGKIQGYLWNLIEPKQIVIQVVELHQDGTFDQYEISNDSAFELRLVHSIKDPTQPLLTLEDGSKIHGVVLDHGCPVVAYLLKMPDSMAVNMEALAEQNYEPGPWIGKLQTAISGQHPNELIEPRSGIQITAGELSAKVLQSKPGLSICYVTDIAFSKENLTKIKAKFSESNVMICETNYRDSDWVKARSKKHLTTHQAAMIAVSLGVRDFRTFHISNLYIKELDAVEAEAQEAFEKFRAMGKSSFQAKIEGEFRR
jgi:ribonuclease Z